LRREGLLSKEKVPMGLSDFEFKAPKLDGAGGFSEF
jgi:hypothetical protein